MEMGSTRIVNASPETVWRALNDPDVLRDSIPGCETFTRESDAEWRVVVAARVGPVSARFNGRFLLADVVPPTSYTLRFEGQGGAAGFASGEARVSLASADGGATALSYAAKAQVGGKLAQLGSRLIDGAAAKMADDFFARFTERVAPAAPEAAAAAPVSGVAEEKAPDKAVWIRYLSIGLILALILYLAARGLR
jgi:carbon monoxide dehydrogenase subunit G